MKRIGILTAGGDTPALNATIHGAVMRANQLRVEVIGFIKGFNSLFNPRVPHVHLNPLFQEIPELDPTKGGTLIGSSRDYVDPDNKEELDSVIVAPAAAGHRGPDLRRRRRHAQRLAAARGAPADGARAQDDRQRSRAELPERARRVGTRVTSRRREWRCPVPAHATRSAAFDLEQMVNYVTPGYATAVFVSASGVERIRTTAESHRRIAIVEVMGRHSGYIALGIGLRPARTSCSCPSSRSNLERLVERVKQIYDLQKNVVIVCGEGIVDEQGHELGAESKTLDPAGNIALSGASEALRTELIQTLGDKYFQRYRRSESAREAIFTRKIGHTQRGGRPILFDRFYAAQLGAKAVDMLLEGGTTPSPILQYNRSKGFHVEGYDANRFRDRWGLIHARQMHPALYDPKLMKPSRIGHRVPAADLHQRHRRGRRGAHAPDAVRRGQPHAAVPLDQHRHQQAHPLPAGGRVASAAGDRRPHAGEDDQHHSGGRSRFTPASIDGRTRQTGRALRRAIPHHRLHAQQLPAFRTSPHPRAHAVQVAFTAEAPA